MTAAPALAETVAAYVAFFESLTPERLDGLDALCTADVRFRDPFNEVVGLTAYKAILARMLEELEEPRFQVRDRAFSAEAAYLRWDMTFRRRAGGAPWRLTGMSELRFDAAGRVAAHIDHWDAASQVYARLPLLGFVLRLIRRRLAAGPQSPEGAGSGSF